MSRLPNACCVLVFSCALSTAFAHVQPAEPPRGPNEQGPRQRREGDGPAPRPERRGLGIPAGVKLLKDISYATIPATKTQGEIDLKLDLYVPEVSSETDHARPLIIWIHGGGWQGGDKERCPAASFVAHGFVVASIQYRLTDVAHWPAQIYDCKAAVRFLRASAGRFDIDADRIGVWGASAGGHLAAMLGETNGDVDKEGAVGDNLKTSSSVQAVCNWFGPTDLVKLAEGVKESPDGVPGLLTKFVNGPLAEKQDVLKDASPLTHVSKDDAPMYIMHGTDDTLVPLEQSTMLKEAFEKAGVKVALDVLPDSGHGNGQFMRIATLTKVKDFFVENLPAAPAKSPKSGTGKSK